MGQQTPKDYLSNADLLLSASQVDDAITKMAQSITNDISDSTPLVLCVMGGGVVFTGQLLPQLAFPP